MSTKKIFKNFNAPPASMQHKIRQATVAHLTNNRVFLYLALLLVFLSSAVSAKVLNLSSSPRGGEAWSLSCKMAARLVCICDGAYFTIQWAAICIGTHVCIARVISLLYVCVPPRVCLCVYAGQNTTAVKRLSLLPSCLPTTTRETQREQQKKHNKPKRIL